MFITRSEALTPVQHSSVNKVYTPVNVVFDIIFLI